MQATEVGADARLRIVPRAGHQWNGQQPDEFSAMLAEFVGGGRGA